MLKRFRFNCTLCRKFVCRENWRCKGVKHLFCSRECYRKFLPTRAKGKRSKAEEYLTEKILADFPDITLEQNERKLLKGLEVDILIPSKGIAIEVNGISHVKPIYGEALFRRTQQNDMRKREMLPKLGYNLLNIDISQFGSTKQMFHFLEQEYSQRIKPLLKY